METTWSVLYTGDHYDALRSPSSDELNQVQVADGNSLVPLSTKTLHT